ncbi:MAG: hypothetical protein ACJAVV_002208 [Alphaproteobacteria bacterium]|jgi:hypothetical protein
MKLQGTFQISDWQETTDQTFDQGSKLTSAKVKQTYSGDIEGTSEISYKMHYFVSSNAAFTGFEYIDAIIDSQPCRLTLKHNGKFENGQASSQFRVIECEPSHILTGAAGDFVAGDGGQAKYSVN